MRKLGALLLSTSTALTTTLISTLLAVVTSGFCYTKLARAVLLQTFFNSSSLKKVLYLGKDLSVNSSTLLFGRYAPWRRLQRPQSGAILMLLAFLVPIILGGIKCSEYFFKKRQDILDTPTHSIYYKKCAKESALAVAKVWDCSKTVGQQKAAIYAAANAVYNSARTYEEKISPLSVAIPGLKGAKGGVTVMNASKKQVPASSTGGSYVKISVSADAANLGKITVQTDDDIASAVPAECNLDVVLAVPVNSTAKVDEIKTELKRFIDGFNDPHTRGVYVGVIPYSGKLSIPSPKYNGWTEGFSALNSNQDTVCGNQQTLTLYDLYGTKGVEGTSLSTKYDDFGSTNGHSIMCRSNFLDATSASTRKYKRMNLNPCSIINEDFLFYHTCFENCPTYTPNPHPIMELVADLSVASAKCGGLSVPSDLYNSSNFIFAALEWSNNLFQSWTDNPGKPAIAGGDSGILGLQDKTTVGRKEAIILFVNKTDTFATDEMTYLGMTDDADKRYFDRYNLTWDKGTMPSAARWESVCYGDGKYVAVAFDSGKAAYSSDGIHWEESPLPTWNDYSPGWYSVCYGDGKFIAVSFFQHAAYSSDGIHWNAVSSFPVLPDDDDYWDLIYYGGGKFVVSGYFYWDDKPCVAYSSDGIHWSTVTAITDSYNTLHSICHGNGCLVAACYLGLMYKKDETDRWAKSSIGEGPWYSVCRGKCGGFMSVGENKEAYSSDGINWSTSYYDFSENQSDEKSMCYGDGYFVVVTANYNKAAHRSLGSLWAQSDMPSSSYWSPLCYGGDKFVAIAQNSNEVAVKQFVMRTIVGNKALKDFLGDGNPSGVTTLTTNACNKLKQAYGSDIRIYVVKYSKETGEYGYLDNCAISTGGKAYDVGNQNNLKAKLNEIAEDLKVWAAYAPARLVN